MKRIAIVGSVLGLLLMADGIYMVVSRYNDGETQAWNLPDGWIIIISATVLLVVSLLAFILSSRPKRTFARKSLVSSEVEPEQA
jgi:uncharacterized membrane protein HdeD (DUF308 family)